MLGHPSHIPATDDSPLPPKTTHHGLPPYKTRWTTTQRSPLIVMPAWLGVSDASSPTSQGGCIQPTKQPRSNARYAGTRQHHLRHSLRPPKPLFALGVITKLFLNQPNLPQPSTPQRSRCSGPTAQAVRTLLSPLLLQYVGSTTTLIHGSTRHVPARRA